MEGRCRGRVSPRDCRAGDEGFRVDVFGGKVSEREKERERKERVREIEVTQRG